MPVVADVPSVDVPDGARPVGDRPDVPPGPLIPLWPMIYDGLRVVDLTPGIAGAYCAKLLTDLGADVVLRGTRSTDPLFVYLRTSQHARARPDGVAGRGRHRASRAKRSPTGAAAPLVTVSITRRRPRRSRRRPGADRAGAAGPQRQPVEPRSHGAAAADRRRATSASTSPARSPRSARPPRGGGRRAPGCPRPSTCRCSKRCR